VLGFAAILLVFRTTDWRGLIQQARDDADRENGGGDGQSGGGCAGGGREEATPSSA
jgi:hypothetical protein